jgi:rsbT co-antagonist protein RsbR
MDVDARQGRMADYMREHHDKIVGRWRDLVVTSVRGRITADEVQRELDDLCGLLLRVMSGGDEEAAGELRATLEELSRSRARNGFRPSETALGVLSVKDAVYELMAESADLVPEFFLFGRMIDDLALHTF